MPSLCHHILRNMIVFADLIYFALCALYWVVGVIKTSTLLSKKVIIQITENKCDKRWRHQTNGIQVTKIRRHAWGSERKEKEKKTCAFHSKANNRLKELSLSVGWRTAFPTNACNGERDIPLRRRSLCVYIRLQFYSHALGRTIVYLAELNVYRATHVESSAYDGFELFLKQLFCPFLYRVKCQFRNKYDVMNLLFCQAGTNPRWQTYFRIAWHECGPPKFVSFLCMWTRSGCVVCFDCLMSVQIPTTNVDLVKSSNRLHFAWMKNRAYFPFGI